MWESGAGATFLFFFPICIVFFVWSLKRQCRQCSVKKTIDRDPQDLTGYKSGKIQSLNVFNPESVYLCMRYWAELGTLLFYIWICEKNPPLPHGKRFGNSYLFWGLWSLFVVYSLTTIVQNKGGKKSATLLNRDQTEEWKGWMQYLFLAYHYFHESSVYNAVRCFISCYVWMTGFGNFSFFYTKADFGIVRLLEMMWRLNFLVFWLCLMFGNSFILYYINPLHTFYFLTTFIVMRVGYQVNSNKWRIRTKLFFWSILIFVVWEFPFVFNTVFGFLGRTPDPGAKTGTLHEWHFRSGLDHWSSLFGMIFALNYPAAQAWLNRVESVTKKKTRKDSSSSSTTTTTTWSLAAKLIVVIPLVAMTMGWATLIYPHSKHTYNSLHPYFFWIPLLTYIALRNLTPALRLYHSSSLAFMGKITLETYLLQHHIWLGDNAKTLYVVVPNAPITNLAVTTITYLFVALRLFRLTIALRAMHVSGSNGQVACIVSVATLCLVIFCAWLLSAGFVANAAATTLCYVVSGMCLSGVTLAMLAVAKHTIWSTDDDLHPDGHRY